MNENKKQEEWLVKDKDGEYVSVLADDWEFGGSGLTFFAGGEKIARFASWQHFRKVVADTEHRSQRENDMRAIILGTVNDLVDSFLYYDREDDEVLPLDAIKNAIANEEISIDEITAYFRVMLIERLSA